MLQYQPAVGLSKVVHHFDRSLLSALNAALSDSAAIEPRRILDLLAQHPTLSRFYNCPAGVYEKNGRLTILEHTSGVLEGLEKYPIAESLRFNGGQPLLDLRALTLILGLHDVGKTLPSDYIGTFSAGMLKHEQHARTLAILAALREQLPISDRQFDLAQVLIGGDLIGSLLKLASAVRPTPLEKDRSPNFVDAQNVPLLTKQQAEALHRAGRFSTAAYRDLIDGWETYVAGHRAAPEALQPAVCHTAQELLQAAGRLGIPAVTLLQHQMLYFQCDARAYTADAFNGTPSLDYLFLRVTAKNFAEQQFLFSKERGRFIFSPLFEAVHTALERELLAAQKGSSLYSGS